MRVLRVKMKSPLTNFQVPRTKVGSQRNAHRGVVYGFVRPSLLKYITSASHALDVCCCLSPYMYVSAERELTPTGNQVGAAKFLASTQEEPIT